MNILRLIALGLLYWTCISIPFDAVAHWWISKQPNVDFFETMTRKQRWFIGVLLIIGLPTALVDTSICRLLQWASGRKV